MQLEEVNFRASEEAYFSVSPVSLTLATINSLCSDKGHQKVVGTGNQATELGFTES